VIAEQALVDVEIRAKGKAIRLKYLVNSVASLA